MITPVPALTVSISQSRCFSVQGRGVESLRGVSSWRFNLAIEMLFSSGICCRSRRRRSDYRFQSRNRDAFQFRSIPKPIAFRSLSSFQSRNRDAFQFRISSLNARAPARNGCFNLAIEMLFSSGRQLTRRRAVKEGFNLAIEMLFSSGGMLRAGVDFSHGFNLAIEMLFSSGILTLTFRFPFRRFQSRNRDAFQFRWKSLLNPN